MSVYDEIENVARNYLRDFPKFFQQTFSTYSRTFDLKYLNVDPERLWVATLLNGSTTELTSSQYTLDARNGLLRLTSSFSGSTSLLVEGYYFEWLLPEDLAFYTRRAVDDHTYNISVPLEEMAPPVIDCIGAAAVVESLWGLLTEYSRDIDVMTSESIHIPASQRYRMVESLLRYWVAEYTKRAQALNIGLERIEVFTLRRVSRTTNRYVPIIKSKELGDYGPIERIFPKIDAGDLKITNEGDELRTDVYIDGDPPTGYVSEVY